MAFSYLFFSIGAFFAMTAVILGAFGAHALKQKISKERLVTFEVGVRYQMYHALGLILLALAPQHLSGVLLETAGWLFTVGIIVFSGSLYYMALSGNALAGRITPLGGLIWIIAWFCVCYAPLKS
ncbi:UPF0382 membrane protein YwdK [Neochlamydia sp. EPS4]|uniref:DUF423 domain-containing protein n=1 Tax=Neochlamydia sp. EPS4 TaxID=1478175 RepID=UPI0005830AA6|nr:DUF423 domain-containing protein [Neochlamydia sp. EPS4]KIC73656.1 UPF0382 membrane protein YwdK [Neochlamydia sp. EPS4]